MVLGRQCLEIPAFPLFHFAEWRGGALPLSLTDMSAAAAAAAAFSNLPEQNGLDAATSFRRSSRKLGPTDVPSTSI